MWPMRCVALDLSRPAAVDLAKRLAAACDIVVPSSVVSRVHGRFVYIDGAYSYLHLG